MDEKRMVPGWGADRSMESRPGVPMELPPRPAPHVHWREPEPQRPSTRVLKASTRGELTPVFGTAQPPHGLSGLIRRWAYRIPEDKTRHWLLLMAADRVDVVESGVSGIARVLRWPAAAAFALFGGAMVARRALR